MWESGRFKLEEISKEFGITPAALHRRFTRNGIKHAANAEVEKRAIQQAISDRVQENEELLDMITEVRELNLKGSMMLAKRTLLTIKNAIDNKTRLESIEGDIKTLERASKVLNINYNTAEKILHLDREDDDTDDLPELEVTPMSQEDIDAIRASQREEEEMILGKDGDEDLDLDDLEDQLSDL